MVGQLKCNESDVCLNPEQICDGKHDCPQNDDEIYCPFDFKCQGIIQTNQFRVNFKKCSKSSNNVFK